MATRLKRLELHGFKSFAAPFTFVFDAGITAVIGPNGSGKSNIADALRWVLGEQSYANLRGRRTEDVIFGGSASRAPVGMAEVTVTLDNEAGELPLPFAEVSITRRAFRSGENHYLINGSRVRLKDVLQVTASLGQAHTVIGQGLVDAVLSQRPDERRGLLEHAAGITGLRLKHAEAERHLAESKANSIRLEDLLTEIEPRLRSLERSAKQAREFGQVRDQLQAALRRFYAWHWRQSAARLTDALRAVEECGARLATLEARYDAARQELDRAGQQARRSEAEHEALEGEIRRVQAERQQASHALALLGERQTAARSRQADLHESREALRAALASSQQEATALGVEAAEIQRAIGAMEARVGALEAASVEARDRRAALEARARETSRALAEAGRATVELEARLAALEGTASSLRDECARVAAERAERQERLAGLARQLADSRRTCQELGDGLAATRAELDAARAELGARALEREEAQVAGADCQRALVDLSTRLETLQRLHESGAGLYAGVKAVLDGARDGRLHGVVGTLASLLQVPAELEAAIEAAIGGHLQDLVVERWDDAERAIEQLKRTRAGRATFQPLDTVRSGARPRQPSAAPGIRGLALDLIGFDPRVEPVISGLLGRVLVAEDLAATRAVLPALGAGWSVVTIGGEITRASGTVTGGARGRESGVLARERELRELPGQVAAARQRLDAARRRLDDLAAAERALRERSAAIEQRLTELREKARAATAARERLELWRAELERAAETERARLDDVSARLEALTQERDCSRQALCQAEARRGELAAEHERLAEALRAEQGAREDGQLHEARAEARALRERRRGVDTQLTRLAAQRDSQARQLRDAEGRIAALAGELAAFEQEQQRWAEQSASLASAADAARERAVRARSALAAAEAEEQAARQRLEGCGGRLREQERERDRLELERARRSDELDLLRERASRDLDQEEVEPLLLGMASDDPGDQAALERDIARLRERLRRIGLVGEDAIEQFEQESERFTFLRRQLDDLHAASESLRTLMAQLDHTMARELDRTFAEVGRAFEETFAALFGGGKARLIPTAEDEMLSGVDIVAQPPGKRLQNLALLSGGERALTAVALLFAILKVNPSPFCLLDEVDAALDESNVVRVRDELRHLSARTQFVVVTHNRATIEGADTLYGITMGDDGVSRVLSLRLPAEAPV